ncbi:MAG: RsmE family RNA methyltransferase [Candidatus Taylorbacteria bacterium]
MRLHRFYIADEIVVGRELTISSADLVHQIRNVFRMKVGDQLVIFNGTGFDYMCKIDKINDRSIIVSNSVIGLAVTESKRNNYVITRKLFLVASVVKKDNFDWIVEKATELGVTDIVPIITERSEKKSLNEERLRRIAIESSEQSGRDTTPLVWSIMGSESAVSSLKKENPGIQILAFHTEGEKFERAKFMGAAGEAGSLSEGKPRATSPIAVFIGPEGGWTPAEIEMFHKENVPVVCLGPQVLRAETAVVAALSVVVFGDWGFHSYTYSRENKAGDQ